MVSIMKAVLCFALATSFQFTTCNAGGKDTFLADSDARITSGKLAEIAEFPHQIALQQTIDGKARQSCGGSILSSKVGLTAAHCLVPARQNLSAHVGSAHRTQGGQVVLISDYLVHALYDRKTMKNDIGLIYFQDAIVFSASVLPIALPTISDVVTDGQLVNASGWGETQVGYQKPTRYIRKSSEELRYVTLRVMTQKTCKRVTKASNIYPGMICGASLTNGSESTCYGDSGGPLTHFNVLYGITSWVSGCGVGKPSGYTNVFDYVDWIQAHFKE